jgi:hypothetical protein
VVVGGWRQGLNIQRRLASNSRSFCLNPLRSGITGVHHHAWFSNSILKIRWKYYVHMDVSGKNETCLNYSRNRRRGDKGE